MTETDLVELVREALVAGGVLAVAAAATSEAASAAQRVGGARAAARRRSEHAAEHVHRAGLRLLEVVGDGRA